MRVSIELLDDAYLAVLAGFFNIFVQILHSLVPGLQIRQLIWPGREAAEILPLGWRRCSACYQKRAFSRLRSTLTGV